MSDANTNVQLGCGSFLTLLTLIFITLKLTDFIDWSWFWVLLPMIVSAVSIGIILLIMLFAMVWSVYRDQSN